MNQTVISQLKCVNLWVEQEQFLRQLISSAESYFASFVYPLRLAISRTEIFTFVNCFHLLSDRLGDFARSLRSHIWTEVQIARIHKRMFCRCLVLASSGTEVDCHRIIEEFNRWCLTRQLLQTILSSALKSVFPCPSKTNRLMKCAFSIFLKMCKYPLSTR